MLHTMSETVIVAALKRGNLRRAVELILDTYQDEIYGYCASVVGATESGAVYQQVLVTALEELPTFNGVVMATLFTPISSGTVQPALS